MEDNICDICLRLQGTFNAIVDVVGQEDVCHIIYSFIDEHRSPNDVRYGRNGIWDGYNHNLEDFDFISHCIDESMIFSPTSLNIDYFMRRRRNVYEYTIYIELKSNASRIFQMVVDHTQLEYYSPCYLNDFLNSLVEEYNLKIETNDKSVINEEGLIEFPSLE